MLLRVLKVIRLLRLMRVARLYRYFARYEMHFSFMNSNVLRLLKVICVMAFFAHWNGCFQYLLATFEANVLSDGSLEFQATSWVARMQADGTMDERNAWSWSFFIAVTQMLAISIGLR